MKKITPYILPTSILVGGIFIISLVAYFNFGFQWDKEKSITFLLSSLGLVFAVFQVVLNIKIQAVRNKTALRHNEYKDFQKLLNSISELLINEMVSEPNVEGLVSALLNKKNEVISFILSNDTYLFDGIKENNVLKETLYIVEDLGVRTDKYRAELDKIEETRKSMQGNIYNPVRDNLLRMEWHNDINKILKRFHELKHQALKEIQKHID
ncbi:hypothetical protein [Pontibacter russatus]|uniref:hypothetical protein n=1 Tax=Pontibacter russatus TaxID=2694929 RepID=UPI001379F8BC|nr:hypothetical protein [Pontibacter russatus]